MENTRAVVFKTKTFDIVFVDGNFNIVGPDVNLDLSQPWPTWDFSRVLAGALEAAYQAGRASAQPEANP